MTHVDSSTLELQILAACRRIVYLNQKRKKEREREGRREGGREEGRNRTQCNPSSSISPAHIYRAPTVCRIVLVYEEFEELHSWSEGGDILNVQRKWCPLRSRDFFRACSPLKIDVYFSYRFPPFFDDNPFGIYQKILAGKIDFPRHLDFSVK